MVNVYISEKDGDVHFSTKNCNHKEFELCRELFKSNYLKYDSISKEWTFPIRLSVLSIIDILRQHNIETTISQDDIDVIKISLYPPSQELKKIKYLIDKELLESYPILKGVPPHEDYQLQAIKKFITQNRLMMNIAPRLGKTYISSIGITSLMKQGALDCVLGVMRVEGLANYKRELVYFSKGYIKESDIVILDKDSRNIEDYFDKKVILMSYSTWRLCNEYYKKANKIISKRPKKPFIRFDKWFEKRLMLEDECQSLCNDSLQYHYTQIHAEYFDRRCVMSGSIGYSYEKMFNLIKILLPQRMSSMTKSEWWEYMTKPTYSKYNREIIPERLKEFEENILDKIMISFDEKCLNMVENYKHNIYVEMTSKMREVYTTFCNDFLLNIMEENNGKVTYSSFKKKFPSLKQITDDPSLLNIPNWNMEKDNPKIEVLKSILDDRIKEKGKNVILWCNSPRTMSVLEKIFAEYNPICVNGNEQLCGVKREERSDIIEKIKTDENCKLLIANQVLSTSVSFWRFSVNIFWVMPIDTDYYAQSIKRIMGDKQFQKNDVETIHLLFNRSIDEYLFENIEHRLARKNYFDNYNDGDEIPMEELKKILNPKHKFDLEGNLL